MNDYLLARSNIKWKKRIPSTAEIHSKLLWNGFGRWVWMHVERERECGWWCWSVPIIISCVCMCVRVCSKCFPSSVFDECICTFRMACRSIFYDTAHLGSMECSPIHPHLHLNVFGSVCECAWISCGTLAAVAAALFLHQIENLLKLKPNIYTNNIGIGSGTSLVCNKIQNTSLIPHCVFALLLLKRS